MFCYNCGCHLSEHDYCTACGADVALYKKIMAIRGLEQKDLIPDIGDLLVRFDASKSGAKKYVKMTEEEKATAFAQGIEMVYKQLMTAFSDMGVTVIDAVGCEFNPDFHNAVMQAPSEEYESGIIIQELQKGYMYKDKVVRHSMVMVAE